MPGSFDRADTPSAQWALRSCQLLTDATDEEIANLACDLEWMRIGADELLFAKGDDSKSLALLVSGRLVVYDPSPPSGELEVWGQVLPGEFVGILSVLMGTSQPASCRAQRDSVLLRIPKERFLQVAHSSAGMMRGLNKLVLQRFREFTTGRKYRQTRLVVGVIPVSDGVSVDDLTCDLITEMRDFVSVLRVRDKDVEAVLGQAPQTIEFGSKLHSRLSRWLLEEESRHDVIVLQANLGDDNWTRLCVRQADTVLMVANAANDPTALPTYDRLRTPSEVGAADRRELLLVHPAHASRPQRTRRWLDVFPVDAHHQVRAGRRTDLRRVARFLTGNAVLLCLSGGAARAFAHIGVLRAMEQFSLPVDMVCGTSIGALIGGLRALDWHSERIRMSTRRVFVEHSIFDFTVPIVSTIKGRRYDRSLDEWFQGIDIEDLWLPFFCMSADLRTAEPLTHDRGSTAFAVRCSGSVPGLFPPVPSGARLLVDGAMLDNLPIERALRRMTGKSIAVSVIQSSQSGIWRQIANAQAPWRAAFDTMSVLRRQFIPPVLEIALQSIFMGTISAADKARSKVDVFIEPQVGRFGLLDASAIDRIIEIGYSEAQQAFAAWRSRDPDVHKL